MHFNVNEKIRMFVLELERQQCDCDTIQPEGSQRYFYKEKIDYLKDRACQLSVL